MKYWRYFCYVCRHKWYVFIYGYQLGIPLLALMHDNSKFELDEFIPYADFFYGGDKTRPGVKAAFDLAWLIHQNRNKHHWQWHLLINDQEPARCIPMPDRYRREMLADWKGAGRAINGVEDAAGWYRANRDKMQLHPETRLWVENQLGIINV